MGKRSVHIPIKLAEFDDGNAKAPVALQLLRTGEFKHFLGDFKLDKKDFENMVKNFKADVIPNDLALDFVHNNQDRAAAWFTGLRIEAAEGSRNASELWMDLKWTTSGRKLIEGGEFRYTSAELHLDYQDPQSLKRFGPTILGAALTNRPFVKGMEPATQLSEMEKIEMENKEIEELKGQMKLLSDRVDGKESEIKKLKDSVSSKDTELKKLKEEKELSEKTSVFDKMFTEGKVVEAQREHYMSGDMVKFSEAAKPINLGGKGNQEKVGEEDPGNEDVEGKIISLADKKMEKDKELSVADAQREVLRENPELEKKYNQY